MRSRTVFGYDTRYLPVEGVGLRFSIVTPCIEIGDALRQTMDSITAQSVLDDPDHSIRYIVQVKCDSGDPSVETSTSSNVTIQTRYEPDSGIYDALTKGFSECDEGDVFCYLGAGDYFSPHALEVVAEVFTDGCEWLTGLTCSYNDRHHLIAARLPFRYRPRLIQSGMYGRWLPHIQQESTFWNRRLHRKVDWTQFRQRKLAGDALLWHEFSRHSDLVVVEAWLGGFEHRLGQASRANPETYRQECESIRCNPQVSDYVFAALDWAIWMCPDSVKRRFDSKRYCYNHNLGCYTRVSAQSGQRVNDSAQWQR